MRLIKSRFSEQVVFNKTSLGGKFQNKAQFSVQFVNRNIRGVGHFEAKRDGDTLWTFNKAQLVFRKSGGQEERDDLFNYLNKIEVEDVLAVDQENQTGEKTSEPNK